MAFTRQFLMLSLILAGATVTTRLNASAHQRAATADEPVTVIGSFDNFRSGIETVSGHSLTLWKHGTRIIGWLQVAEGQPGTFETDLIDKGSLDVTTHRLILDASSGVVRHSFTGTLTSAAIDGELSRHNPFLMNTPVGPTIRYTLHLRRNREDTQRMINYATYDEWKAVADAKIHRSLE